MREREGEGSGGGGGGGGGGGPRGRRRHSAGKKGPLVVRRVTPVAVVEVRTQGCRGHNASVGKHGGSRRFEATGCSGRQNAFGYKAP